MTEHTQANGEDRGNDRRFAVSSNRGSARHRLRYVETGGASVDTEECTFCQSGPELDWQAETVATTADTRSERGVEQGNRPDND